MRFDQVLELVARNRNCRRTHSETGELTTLRAQALRAEIAKRPDLALAIIVRDLAFHAF